MVRWTGFFKVVLVGVANFFITASAAQDINAVANWEKIGPGGGGATFIPTISYHSPETFLLRCDMTGSYQTKNGGKSYQQINFANGATSFAFDPGNRNLAYAGATALYQTSDGGTTWKQILPKPAEVQSSGYFGDHAEFHLITKPGTLFNPGAGPIKSIRVDPLNSGNLYFAAGPALFFSRTKGESWEKRDFTRTIDYVYTNGSSAKNSVFLFSADSLFVFQKVTGTVIANPLPVAMQPAFSFTAGIEKKTGRTIFYALHNLAAKTGPYAFNQTEIWVSYDLGRHWTSAGIPGRSGLANSARPSLTMIACAEFDAGKAYVVTNMLEETRKDQSSRYWYGAFKTADAGKTWHWVWKGGGGSGQYGVRDAKDAANLKDAWVHQAFGSEFIQLFDVGVAPNNGEVAVVTDWYRTIRTTDGGSHWQEVYSRSNSDGSFTSRGVDVTTSYTVHFDPMDTNHIAISYTDIGFHHSFDQGKSWFRAVNGVPPEWVNTCYSVAFDPAVKNKIWSAWSGWHDYPRGKMTRNPNWRQQGRGGICVSADGGKSWTPSIEGMGDNSPATSVIVDPHSPPGNRTLYATVYSKGVFKSIDDGKHWTLMNAGLDTNTCAFEITQANNGNLYLIICPTPVHEKGVMQARYYTGAVYRSTDGAASWKKLSVSDNGNLFPSGIEADPQHPDRLYLGCWADISMSDLLGGLARKNGIDTTIRQSGGIFLSEDGGDHWIQVFDPKHYVYDVTVDPFHPGRVYANTFNKAAFRSDDSGQHWKQIKGYDFHWGHRVIVDQNHPEKVYLTSFGSSVWHGFPLAEE